MQKIFNFLILLIAKVVAKIVTSTLYRESQRASGLTERKFAFNAILSLTLLAALGIVALVVALQ